MQAGRNIRPFGAETVYDSNGDLTAKHMARQIINAWNWKDVKKYVNKHHCVATMIREIVKRLKIQIVCYGDGYIGEVQNYLLDEIEDMEAMYG